MVGGSFAPKKTESNVQMRRKVGSRGCALDDKEE